MADDRQTTTFEIKVDDKEVEGLRKTLEAALDTRRVQNYNRELQNTSRRLEETHTKVNHHQRRQRSQGGGVGRQRDAGGRFVGGVAGGGGGGGPQRGTDGRFVPRGGSGGGGGEGSPQKGPSAARTGFAAGVGGYMGARAAQVGQAGGSLTQGEGAMESAASTIPVVGPFIAGLLGQVRRYYGQGVQADRSVVQTMGATGFGSRGEVKEARNAGRAFGMDESSTLQFAQQAASSAALRGGELQELLPKLMGLQTFGGLSVGATAGLVGAAGTATTKEQREGQDNAELLETAVGAGVAAGLREEKLGDWLQEIASITDAQRKRGVRFDPTSFSQLAASLGGLGGSFQGEAGTQAARSLTEATQGLGDGNTILDLMALKIAQQMSRASGGEGTIAEAGLVLEEQAAEVLPKLIQEMNKQFAGMSEGARAMMLKETLGKSGAQVSRRQALELIQKEGNLGLADAGGLRAQGAGFEEGRTAEGRGSKALGNVRGDIGVGQRRIEFGRNSQAHRGVANAELDMVDALQPLATATAKKAAQAAKAGAEFYKEHGGKAEETAKKVVTKVGETYDESVKNVETGIGIIVDGINKIADAVRKALEAIGLA